MSSLKKYQTKRNFNKTKEPAGKITPSSARLRFVVQHHLARRDHYDLRLEWHGVMKSWAVPKGPSYNPQDKRLAVQVEDHPLSYRHFEGTIPQGEYGGGTVMVWDEGTWEPMTKIPKNFNVSSFKFVLKGKRLQGAWTLVHFKDDNWLLIKENDNIFLYDDINVLNKSIKTNRTMEQITANKKILQPKRPKTIVKDNIIEGIKITNPDKLIFKSPRITKLDIAYYYHKVAKRMFPLIKERIISTIRCPDGLNGEKFFMKHFNPQNEGLKEICLKNSQSQDETYYYFISSQGLISEVQMNSFEFHTWGSKVPKIESPDVMVFDLDPDESLGIDKLREGVRDLKSILDKLKLKAYLKVSGGKGYHVVVPIKKKMTWESFRATAKNVAKLMETTWPDKYTSNIRKNKRKGKIFIDWVRNTRSATSVAPYSIRLRKKCSVSLPISWQDLDKIKPDDITIDLAIKSLKKKDPWLGFKREITK